MKKVLFATLLALFVLSFFGSAQYTVTHWVNIKAEQQHDYQQILHYMVEAAVQHMIEELDQLGNLPNPPFPPFPLNVVHSWKDPNGTCVIVFEQGTLVVATPQNVITRNYIRAGDVYNLNYIRVIAWPQISNGL